MNEFIERIAAMTIDTPEAARALLLEVTSKWLGPIRVDGVFVVFTEFEQVAADLSQVASAVCSHAFIAENYHLSSVGGVHTFSLVPKSTLPSP